MRTIFVTLLLCAMLALASCIDPEPGEISIKATKDGRSQSCSIMILNDKGVQIDEANTDEFGVGYLKDLKPGTYTLKFKDGSGNMYPAEKTVELHAGDSTPVQVELNEAPAAGGDATGGGESGS
jgi:hypothetical protein